MTVRVRFAPSPTGQLHVGNARTALFNWLFARHEGGAFVLRLEDTDVDREQAGAEASIYEDLVWLGLDWDEGPLPGAASAARGEGAGRTPEPVDGARPESGARHERGARGPYRQSERGRFYQEALDALLAKGSVYPCFCTDELLEEDRRAALASGRTPGYSGRCAGVAAEVSAARRTAGEPHAWRFRVGRYGVVSDIVRGTVDFRAREPFDPVIRRRNGRPTYNFAAVVDDTAMEISHVIRGDDHLTNTALQLRLYEAFGASPPRFAHLPLILGPDGTPLSKRHGATSVGEMRARGYPAEALANGLALLGWTPPGERVLMERAAMVALFDLRQVGAAPAIFDLAKLDWISGQKIRAMDPRERGRLVAESLRQAGLVGEAPLEDRVPGSDVAQWFSDLGALLATSIDRFDQVPERARFIFTFDPPRAVASGALEEDGARLALEAFARLFEAAGPIGPEAVPVMIDEARAATGLKGRALLHPLRAAVTGQESGPELARVIPLIDRAARLKLAPGLVGPAARIRLVLAARDEAPGPDDSPEPRGRTRS